MMEVLQALEKAACLVRKTVHRTETHSAWPMVVEMVDLVVEVKAMSMGVKMEQQMALIRVSSMAAQMGSLMDMKKGWKKAAVLVMMSTHHLDQYWAVLKDTELVAEMGLHSVERTAAMKDILLVANWAHGMADGMDPDSDA